MDREGIRCGNGNGRSGDDETGAIRPEQGYARDEIRRDDREVGNVTIHKCCRAPSESEMFSRRDIPS